MQCPSFGATTATFSVTSTSLSESGRGLDVVTTREVITVKFTVPFPTVSNTRPPLNSCEPGFMSFELTLTDVPVRPIAVLTSSSGVSPGVFSIEAASGYTKSFADYVTRLSADVYSGMASK